MNITAGQFQNTSPSYSRCVIELIELERCKSILCKATETLNSVNCLCLSCVMWAGTDVCKDADT